MSILGRGDWTEEYHALIDGKAQVDVYVTRREDIYFQYSSKETQPARTGRYRVADLQVFVDALVKRTPGEFVISPGELLDKKGKRFTVMEPGIDLFIEGPPPKPVVFDLESFTVEVQPPEPGIKRIHPVTHLVMQFLDKYPKEGGLLEFIAWANAHPDVKSIEYGGSITWIDPAGQQQVRLTKSVTNRIGPLRRKRQQ